MTYVLMEMERTESKKQKKSNNSALNVSIGMSFFKVPKNNLAEITEETLDEEEGKKNISTPILEITDENLAFPSENRKMGSSALESAQDGPGFSVILSNSETLSHDREQSRLASELMMKHF